MRQSGNGLNSYDQFGVNKMKLRLSYFRVMMYARGGLHQLNTTLFEDTIWSQIQLIFKFYDQFEVYNGMAILGTLLKNATTQKCINNT